jgi:hypothetical protein
MIDRPTSTRSEVLAQLWRWLPGVYRSRDTDGRLYALLGLYADELWRVRKTIEQHYADHFIDSAQDWVIAYLADLVGTEVLFGSERFQTDPSQASSAQAREFAIRNRDDVKNTLRWRRQKGTLPGLAGVASDIGGLGTHAVEMFERTAWLQNLNHIKPGAHFAVDLRDAEAVAALSTPFTSGRALADWRPTDQRRGWHRTTNVAVFTWPLPSFPLVGVQPKAIGGDRFTFHPLGLSTALHAGGATDALREAVRERPGAIGADICRPHTNDTPIRTADLRAHPVAYVDSPLGFSLYEDGIPLIGEAPAAVASRVPVLDYGDLADLRGIIPADAGAFGAGARFRLDAVRLGAVFASVNGVLAPVTYAPGQPLANHLQLRNPQGRLKLDGATPDFGYTVGALAYEPDSGEYHHPSLLVRVVNEGAVATNFPQCEIILRNSRGLALQIYLPAIPAVPPNAEHYLFIADDGSSYFARGDHQDGIPNRNPDASLFGAFLPQHLARASEGQRRVRPGNPSGVDRWRRLTARSLCCWGHPLAPPLNPGEVAIDPERGRIAFAAGEAPAGEITADFRYVAGHAIGAGPHARTDLPTATLTVARTRDAQFASLQAAIAAAPDGAAAPVVIEILDSAVYEEALSIDNRQFPGGLVIQAAALQTPFIVKPVPAPQLLRMQNSTMTALMLDGLTFAGGTLQVGGDVPAIDLRHCSLRPADTSLAIVQAAACDITMRACITGAVAVTALSGRLVAEDSIFQHPMATVEMPIAGAALQFPNGEIDFERCTAFGDTVADYGRVSNTLCYGRLLLANAGCLRFSRIPKGHSGAAFRCTSAMPIFVSTAWGDAGYMVLHHNSAPVLLRGGEEGGEIGAFAGFGLPWRSQNIGLRLAQSIPAGLTPIQVRVLPRPRFKGLTSS